MLGQSWLPLVPRRDWYGKRAGTPLAPILQEAGVLDKGIEVVFFGSDAGQEEVRGIIMPQNFARSMVAGRRNESAQPVVL